MNEDCNSISNSITSGEFSIKDISNGTITYDPNTSGIYYYDGNSKISLGGLYSNDSYSSALDDNYFNKLKDDLINHFMDEDKSIEEDKNIVLRYLRGILDKIVEEDEGSLKKELISDNSKLLKEVKELKEENKFIMEELRRLRELLILDRRIDEFSINGYGTTLKNNPYSNATTSTNTSNNITY